MDCSLPVVSDDGDLPWSDRHSMDSDDEHSAILTHAPRWMNASFPLCSAQTASAALSSSGAASHMTRAGQLSPISTSMDASMLADGNGGSSCPPSATAPAMVHSASSSSCAADSWSIDFGDSDDLSASESANDVDVHWEQGSDDVLTLPKPEPIDDEYFCLDDVKEVPITPVQSSSATTPAQPKIKRPRGRPRKNPLPPSLSASKVTKGRSKTGCITCRKRKKKCDEAKPRCMNCEKNSVVCEGYMEKQIWKSGKEKAEEARLRMQAPLVITMQPIFDGLETLEDRIFWKHYNDHLSTVLTVENEHRSAFKEMLIPIATRDQGLMHSILSLSSIHLDYDTPHGANLLKKYPGTSIEALRRQSSHHQARAMDALRSRNTLDSDLSLSAMYGQMLCLILESVAEGRSDDHHRLHLRHYQNLIRTSPPQDPAFLAFITEFFQYHIFADELIRYPGRNEQLLQRFDETEPLAPANSIEPARLLGVADGLFNHLSEITAIRNRIRDNIAAQADPVVDYPSLYQAEEISQAIADWNPAWPPGDSRQRIAGLYKQMMWVYLYRTVYPPSPSSSLSSSVTAAAGGVPVGVSVYGPAQGRSSLVHTPPKSPSASCSPSPLLRPNTAGAWPHGQDIALQNSLRRHSIAHYQPAGGAPQATMSSSRLSSFANSDSSSVNPQPKRHTTLPFSSAAGPAAGPSQQQHRQQSHQQRADSPPPIRHPPHQDPRITLAVEESLTIMDSLKSGDPAQTLLLIPCLVVGTACFAPAQQDRVRAAISAVRGYTGLRNADCVVELLEEVWRLMAAGDWLAVWDWQGVANRLGLDFLCA